MDLYEVAILIDQIVRGFGSGLLFRSARGANRYENPTSLDSRSNEETTTLQDGTPIGSGNAIEKGVRFREGIYTVTSLKDQTLRDTPWNGYEVS